MENKIENIDYQSLTNKKNPERSLNNPKTIEEANKQYALQRLKQVIATRNKMNKVEKWLDKYHLDGLLGFFTQQVGDIATAGINLYMINEARKCGIPNKDLTKMFTNFIIDTFSGSFPIVGDIVDFCFKSNARNAKIFRIWLVEKYVPELRKQGIPIPPELANEISNPKNKPPANSSSSIDYVSSPVLGY